MEQLPLPYYGKTIDMDGKRDPVHQDVQYLGQATIVFDNTYRVRADIGGVYEVEVEIIVSRDP